MYWYVAISALHEKRMPSKQLPSRNACSRSTNAGVDGYYHLFSFLFFSFLLTACGYFLLFDKYVLPLSLYIHFS
jgi:hypothetical protein